MKTGNSLQRLLFSILAILSILALSGCQSVIFPILSGGSDPESNPSSTTPQVTQLVAEVKFVVSTPPGMGKQELQLEIMDEVTGLALNSTRYLMQKSQTEDQYTLTLSVPINSVIKYRYLRGSNPPTIEYTGQGKQVRYRMIEITAPGNVEDVITAWIDQPYAGKFGRIQGQVVNAENNTPIPNILVVAGGAQSITASDGTFIIDSLPTGLHSLIAYSMDGAYQVFQQGAEVAEDSTTQASLRLVPAPLVDITFDVTLPTDTNSLLPVRMVGNLYQLGNTFADLQGGASVLASRAPVITKNDAGKYLLTMKLPAGTYLEYKYTTGDGFWNAEHQADGKFRIRKIIVPSQASTVIDTVETWKAGDTAAIEFTANTPLNTPPDDIISIQFNPFGWMLPIPMVKTGENRWYYRLESPLNILSSAGYRFCRNDQCGVADDIDTAGVNSAGYPFNTNRLLQTFNDDIAGWAYWHPSSTGTTIIAPEVKPRGPFFFAGIETLNITEPTWQPHMEAGIKNIKSLNANWIVLTPNWTYTQANPPVLEPVTGKDPLWFDLSSNILRAQQEGLKVALFPTTKIDPAAYAQWQATPHNAGWWQSWFDRYSTFVMHHADLATQTNSKALILGEASSTESYPGAILNDGTPSTVPANSEEHWRQLISNVRNRFGGNLYWAVNYPDGLANIPTWVSELDGIYLIFSGPIINGGTPTQSDLEAAFARIMDEEIFPIQQKINKPIILALGYPSAKGAANGCISAAETCLAFPSLDQPNADIPIVEMSTQEQVDIYSAALSILNDRSWLGGFVSRGYYPPVALQDKSNSIHGKPAADILWYWYPLLLSNPPQ